MNEINNILQAAVERPDIIQKEIDREFIGLLKCRGLFIGDTVRSKNPNGQVKIPGTLVGLLKADFYVDTMLNDNGKRNPHVDPDVVWGRLNPNWRNEPVAIVFFNIPQKSATKEEWVESGVQQGFRREDCEASYEHQCPFINQIVLPVNDLELCDDE